jgi:hypothetical protein
MQVSVWGNILIHNKQKGAPFERAFFFERTHQRLCHLNNSCISGFAHLAHETFIAG